MIIGIMGAMDEEIALYLEDMRNKVTITKAGITYHIGEYQGKKVVLCKSGVGKVNAAVCTQILIQEFQVSQVIFTGVAGAVHPDLHIGDIVISTDCMQHDIDATSLGFKPGEIPYEKTWCWIADDKLKELAMNAGRQLEDDIQIVTGRILSGDQFIADRQKVQQLSETFQAACTEMEGAAVAQVCSMNEVPFVIVRAMSDCADGSAQVNFLEFTKLASKRSYQMVSNMLHTMEKEGA
ncbi:MULTISPECIES: 5'-methylthioadenosine/adenosylhomocysteine nucleosidase [Brevibacillus]|uniref:5'-methylthioadenosine/adenosylhomocysteine nucleosidase n=1 Tax=Brevibacillus TaxID=55080 RepID=UPI000B9B47AF|nr:MULTISPECIES: 5'-methylthioadenosine/adenosylhomocysteine nucleosidase [Brevibacillus]MBG9787493.1 MTA/SAH nucleosidase [Brevibacillus laterosporus]MCG7319409.1 5'-methylthioadenosine/adenosylhomocysteine nucleosidase [Brevibacillus laterosporus]MED1787103.1 5'-methylthioadenosine/adenosylhomocysteine nucleosidase [Brevibacillus laterosporus]RFB32284.1 5'-methylthioadenosine/adenosylhomocysteine nucleosidase [Brevibacillus sp. VP]